MEILCPFCLKEHVGNECKQEGKDPKKISQAYIDDVSAGMPVYPIIVIGYSGCGKTTFLCSLFKKLYDSIFFHIEPLDQSTINKIKDDYYPTLLDKRTFLPPTNAESVFEDPLLIKLTVKQKKRHNLKKDKDRILLIYDVSGETYVNINTAALKLPFIAHIPNLVILIDLFAMYKKYTDRLEIELQNIISTIRLTLKELHSSPKDKNAIICFTKSDEYWGMKGIQSFLGPLAEMDNLQENIDFEEYSKQMVIKSYKIEKFLKNNRAFDDFYESIAKSFGAWFFIDVSSVGGKVDHSNNTFDQFSPYRVIDPILWLINS